MCGGLWPKMDVLAEFCFRFDIYIGSGVCYSDKRYVDHGFTFGGNL